MNCKLSKYLLNDFYCKNVTGGVSSTTPPPAPQSEGHQKSPTGLNRVNCYQKNLELERINF